jgi:restriction endonuclease S subunit
MLESGSKTTVGDLLDAGLVEVTAGFPFGGHNDAHEGIPHIRPFNVRPDAEISLQQIKSIPHDAASGKPRLARNDIVFNNTNTKELVGKCALWQADEAYVFSNHMTRLRVLDNSIVPAYLNFAIFQHWLVGKSEMLARAHVAQASIMGERFREIEIIWRDTDEQLQISDRLSLLLRARRSQGAQIENTNLLKRATMQELFTRGLRGAVSKETEIGSVPESWDVIPLGSLGRVGNGSTPKRSIPEYWAGGTYPWLTSAKVYDREINSADQFVSERALRECHLPRVEPGAILIAITGQGKTLGHCAVLGMQATINQHIAYVATDTKRADPSFVRGYLETQYDYLRQVGSGGGSTKGALTCAFLRGLPIPFPKLDEQREIVAILDTIDRKLDLHKRRRVVLDELFKALLNKLMTGELRVAETALLDGVDA